MQIEAIIFHLAPMSLANITKLKNTNCQKGLSETREPMPSW